MSEEQVEVVPRGWEGFKAGMARGDPAGGAFEFGAYAPDCEWLPPKEFRVLVSTGGGRDLPSSCVPGPRTSTSSRFASNS